MCIEYNTIIIGGGVLGNSIAYHLSAAQQDKSVAVIEEQFPLCGASGANQGWVWVHTKQPAWYCELSYYSAELYKYLDRKIGDVEYRRTGGIAPFFTEEEKKRAYKLVEDQAEAGIHIDILNREEALSMEPALSSNIMGATYCEADGNVNPFRLVEQYMKQAKKQGVSYEMYQTVVNIQQKNDGYKIQTQDKTFFCRQLVLSAGLGLIRLGKMLGIHIPIHPEQGQVLITEALPPFLRHTVQGVRQTYNGEILIGYTHFLTNLDRNTNLDVLSQISQFAVKLIPDLSKVKIVRSFAGLRVMPDDEFPIMGHIDGFDNLYVTAMHSGITLSPLVGTLMTQLLTGQETDLPMERFSMSRFA